MCHTLRSTVYAARADSPEPFVWRTGSATSQSVTKSEAARPLVGDGQPPAAPTAAAPRVGVPRPQASVALHQPGSVVLLPAPLAPSVIRPAAAALSPSVRPRPAPQPRPPILALPREMVRRSDMPGHIKHAMPTRLL